MQCSCGSEPPFGDSTEGELRRVATALTLVVAVRVDLYGARAAAGPRHGTLRVRCCSGSRTIRPSSPRNWNPGGAVAQHRQDPARQQHSNHLSEDDIALHPRKVLEFHPNGMTLTATAADSSMLHRDLLLGRRRIRRHRSEGDL